MNAASSSSRPPTTPRPARRSPVLVALFVLSLAANIALAWLAFRPGVKGGSGAADSGVAAGSRVSEDGSLYPKAGAGKPAGELGAYASLGTFVAENNRIPDLHWTEPQFQAFLNGMRASFEGRGYALDDDAKKLRDDINGRVQKMLAADRPDPVQEYFKSLREKEHVQQTASGLHYRLTDIGTGKSPTLESTVLMSYSAKLPSGESLPNLSRSRVRTKVADLLPGLREAIQLFKVGTKGLVYLPPDLSFGTGDWPTGVPRGAPIVFFVELHEVE